MKKKILVIGLGKQVMKDHLPAIRDNNQLEIVGLVDQNVPNLKLAAKEYGVPGFKSTKEALSKVLTDCALVAVPHNQYFEILTLLAENKIPTLKEKPIAMNLEEAERIIELYRSNNTYLQICVQRRFSNLYDTTKQLLNEIGSIYSLYAEYTLNLPSLDSSSIGWRANKDISGGGATLDLGYHMIDLLINLFGEPDLLYAQLNYNSLPGDYTIDDSVKAMFTFDNKINSNILVTKIFGKKGERIRIFGTKGFVYIDDRTVSLRNRDNDIIESHSFNTKEHEVNNQLNYFIENMHNKKMLDIKNNSILSDQLINMKVIDAIYRSDKIKKVMRFDNGN